jgi:hypothetical protein
LGGGKKVPISKKRHCGVLGRERVDKVETRTGLDQRKASVQKYCEKYSKEREILASAVAKIQSKIFKRQDELRGDFMVNL